MEASKLVSTIKNPIERDLEIDRLSKEYKVTRSAIINYINRNKQNYEDKRQRRTEDRFNKDTKRTKTVSKNLQDGLKKSKYQIMAYAASEENYIKVIKKCLNLEENLEKNEVEIIKSLEEEYKNGEKNPLLKLKEDGKISETSYRIVSEIEVSHENPELFISELSKTIIKNKLEEDLKSALDSLKNLNKEEPDYTEKMQKLSETITDINKKLKGGM